MSTQCYICPTHGPFTVTQNISDPVLPIRQCPTIVSGRYSPDSLTTPTICGRAGEWRPSAPAAVTVEGGTGAGRQMNQRRNDARERFKEEHNLER